MEKYSKKISAKKYVKEAARQSRYNSRMKDYGITLQLEPGPPRKFGLGSLGIVLEIFLALVVINQMGDNIIGHSLPGHQIGAGMSILLVTAYFLCYSFKDEHYLAPIGLKIAEEVVIIIGGLAGFWALIYFLVLIN